MRYNRKKLRDADDCCRSRRRRRRLSLRVKLARAIINTRRPARKGTPKIRRVVRVQYTSHGGFFFPRRDHIILFFVGIASRRARARAVATYLYIAVILLLSSAVYTQYNIITITTTTTSMVKIFNRNDNVILLFPITVRRPRAPAIVRGLYALARNRRDK